MCRTDAIKTGLPRMAKLSSDNASDAVQSHEPFVRALARKYAPAPGLADDIVQQVFTEFLAKRDAWDFTTDIRPLFHTMTRHVAQRCWRDHARRMPSEQRQLAEHIQRLAESREASVYGEDEKAALRQCLEKLPEKSRRLIEGHYQLGVSSADIASGMNLSADAVRQALCRLRGSLRKCMESTLSPGNARMEGEGRYV